MDILLNKLRDIELRYQELEGLLSDPQVVSKQGLYQKYAKEHSDLTELVETIRLYEKLKVESRKTGNCCRKMTKKSGQWPRKKYRFCRRKRLIWKKKIKILLLPKDPNDDKNVFLEIRAGTGGDEAGLFVGDLFHAVRTICRIRGGGWKLSVHLLRAVWAVLRKLSPRLMAGAHTAA